MVRADAGRRAAGGGPPGRGHRAAAWSGRAPAAAPARAQAPVARGARRRRRRRGPALAGAAGGAGPRLPGVRLRLRGAGRAGAGGRRPRAGPGDLARRLAACTRATPSCARCAREHFGDAEALARPRIAPVVEREVGAHANPGPHAPDHAAHRPARADRRCTARLSAGPATSSRWRRAPTAAAPGPDPARWSWSGPARWLGCCAASWARSGRCTARRGCRGRSWSPAASRVLAGAIAGGLGRPFGRRGWFYRVAGPRTAMIDDVAACLPPHDHHLDLRAAGARAGWPASWPARWAAAWRSSTPTTAPGPGCSARPPASTGEWVAAALADNPAGNEDERTPVVIVRPLDRAGRNPSPRSPAAINGQWLRHPALRRATAIASTCVGRSCWCTGRASRPARGGSSSRKRERSSSGWGTGQISSPRTPCSSRRGERARRGRAPAPAGREGRCRARAGRGTARKHSSPSAAASRA